MRVHVSDEGEIGLDDATQFSLHLRHRCTMGACTVSSVTDATWEFMAPCRDDPRVRAGP
jgi:hypothetical protein